MTLRPLGTRSTRPAIPSRSGRLSGDWVPASLLTAALLAGCAGDAQQAGEDPAGFGPRPWATPDSWWDVTLEAVSEPDLFLTSIDDVEVDSRGRVFLVDSPTGGIIVLTPGLEYLRTVGRDGEGPGEFQSRQVQVLPGDTLFVYDFILGRITVFDPDDLEVVSTLPPPNREQDIVTNLWKIPGEGRYFALDRSPYRAGEGEAADQGRTEVLLAFEESADGIVDTLATVTGSESLVVRRPGLLMVGGHPFGRESLVRTLGEDRIVYANSGAFEVAILDFNGPSAGGISHPTTPIPVTSAELEAELQDRSGPLADALRAGAPYTWPALAGLVTDDQDRIWIGIRGPGDSSEWEWAAFAPDGIHAGSIRLPAGHLLQVVRDGRLYVLSHDELDVPSIQAYRLDTGER